MPQAPVPFTPDQKTGDDVLNGAAPVALNVIIDKSGTVKRRPGIIQHGTAQESGAVIGLHSTATGEVYSVNGITPGIQRVSRLLNKVPLELGSYSGLERPIIAETEAILAIASGRQAVKVEFSNGNLSALGGSPPVASHVIANGSRLIANDVVEDQTKVHYSAPALGTSFAGHEQWSVLDSAFGRSGFFTAESRPDPVVALGENTNEIFVFGTTSLQVYGPDASFIYIPITTLEHGCSSPNGIIKADGQFAWMDERRRFVTSNGRAVTMVSGPIQQELDDLPSIEGMFGYRVEIGPVDLLCWTIPGDGRTFVYNISSGGWSTWRGANLSQFSVTAHASLKGSHTQLVGLSDGRYGELRMDAFTDIGAVIPAYVETGFISRGTDNRKHCKVLRLVLRRGVSSGSTSEVGIEFRDTEGDWSSPLRIPLGSYTGSQFVVELRSLGTYRRRQWRFRFHGAEEITLAGATEDFDVLSH